MNIITEFYHLIPMQTFNNMDMKTRIKRKVNYQNNKMLSNKTKLNLTNIKIINKNINQKRNNILVKSIFDKLISINLIKMIDIKYQRKPNIQFNNNQI